MRVQSFTSYEDMLKAIREAHEAAELRVQEWQKSFQIGDFFVRPMPEYDLVIYGEILDPSKPAESPEKYSAEDLELIREEAKVYDEPHMKGMKFCRCFSVACEYGELGDTHISVMAAKISKEVFEAARSSGWPTDLLVLFKKDIDVSELASELAQD